MRARRGAACLQIAILSMFLIGGLFAGAPETAGAQKKPDKKMPSSVYEELRTFTEVLSYLKKNYVENVEDHKLVYGAVRGMLRTLDPHTTFLPPEVFRESQVETRGKFGGLGIEITIRQGVLTVISPIDG
ncbi:MAG TPA: peptidase S41, partial [Nitrospinota bacterium]|nr:peptidase S41 [Nitrospinota bacterium]